MDKAHGGARWLDRGVLISPCIGLCQTEKQFRFELKRLGIAEYRAMAWVADGKDATVHILDRKGVTCFLVCIRTPDRITHLDIIGLLIHEAVHIWRRMLQEMGEEYPGEEIEAYGLQAIAQKLISAYKMKKAKK